MSTPITDPVTLDAIAHYRRWAGRLVLIARDRAESKDDRRFADFMAPKVLHAARAEVAHPATPRDDAWCLCETCQAYLFAMRWARIAPEYPRG